MIYKTIVDSLYQTFPLLRTITQSIEMHGGKALLVGGAVRDALLAQKVKDYDIEVYHLSLEQLSSLLAQYGTVCYVGAAFGVLKVSALPIDWSLPRADSQGRRPTVYIDPSMNYKHAFGRRDLTINAIGIDLMTGECIDPYQGVRDLERKLLRAPIKERFVEDPLRFFRVMQFVGRFTMWPDEQLQDLCKTMEISTVAQERSAQEFEKLIMYASRPSRGFVWLQSIGRLQALLPELYQTIGVPQDKRWHPEGDVFAHSLQALDAAVSIAASYGYEGKKKLLLCYAALCHDLGKVSTTFEDATGIHSYGHAEKGAPLAQSLLQRIMKDQKKFIESVATLVYFHMAPGLLVRSHARVSRYHVLAGKLWPRASMEQLALLAFADRQGRNGHVNEPLTTYDKEITSFMDIITAEGIAHKPLAPLLTGKDLLPLVHDEKKIGQLLQKAYTIQLEEEIKTKEELTKRIVRKK